MTGVRDRAAAPDRRIIYMVIPWLACHEDHAEKSNPSKALTIGLSRMSEMVAPI